MVGDSLAADVQGGINAGLLATVWVCGAQSELPAGAPRPTYTISRICDLESVLDQIG